MDPRNEFPMVLDEPEEFIYTSSTLDTFGAPVFDIPEIKEQILSRLDYISLKSLCATNKQWRDYCNEVGLVFWKTLFRNQTHLSFLQINYILDHPLRLRGSRHDRVSLYRQMLDWMNNANVDGEYQSILWPGMIDPFRRDELGNITNVDVETSVHGVLTPKVYALVQEEISRLGLDFTFKEKSVKTILEKIFSSPIEDWRMPRSKIYKNHLLVSIWQRVVGFPRTFYFEDHYFNALRYAKLDESNKSSYTAHGEHTGYAAAIMVFYRWLFDRQPFKITLDPIYDAPQRIQKLKAYLSSYHQLFLGYIKAYGFKPDMHDTEAMYLLYNINYANLNYTHLLTSFLRIQSVYTIQQWIQLFLFGEWPNDKPSASKTKRWIEENVTHLVGTDTFVRLSMLGEVFETSILMLVHYGFLRKFENPIPKSRKSEFKSRTTLEVLDMLFEHGYPMTQQSPQGNNVMHFTLMFMIKTHDQLQNLRDTGRYQKVYPFDSSPLVLLKYYTDNYFEETSSMLLEMNKDGFAPIDFLYDYIVRTAQRMYDVELPERNTLRLTVIYNTFPSFVGLINFFYTTLQQDETFEPFTRRIEELRTSPEWIQLQSDLLG